MSRCNQCGTVLSSMWRLRQHLAGHAQTQETERREDHVYGRTSRSGTELLEFYRR